jgi:hypothetical protein
MKRWKIIAILVIVILFISQWTFKNFNVHLVNQERSFSSISKTLNGKLKTTEFWVG